MSVVGMAVLIFFPLVLANTWNSSPYPPDGDRSFPRGELSIARDSDGAIVGIDVVSYPGGGRLERSGIEKGARIVAFDDTKLVSVDSAFAFYRAVTSGSVFVTTASGESHTIPSVDPDR